MADQGPIVEAAGSIAFSTNMAPAGKARSRAIEAAMVDACEEAAAEGVTDHAEILARKLAARERVKAELVPAAVPDSAE